MLVWGHSAKSVARERSASKTRPRSSWSFSLFAIGMLNRIYSFYPSWIIGMFRDFDGMSVGTARQIVTLAWLDSS